MQNNSVLLLFSEMYVEESGTGHDPEVLKDQIKLAIIMKSFRIFQLQLAACVTLFIHNWLPVLALSSEISLIHEIFHALEKEGRIFLKFFTFINFHTL